MRREPFPAQGVVIMVKKQESNNSGKKHSGAFTLIELLVVIAIIAVLMAILMPALNRIKSQAKDVKCRAIMKQWGLVWAMYTDDNDGKFPVYLGANWMRGLTEYYGDTEELLYCPMTVRTHSEGADWPVAIIEGGGGQRYGSFAINEWIYDSGDTSGGRDLASYWRSTGHKGLSNVPVMGDGVRRADAQPNEFDEPPEFNGQNRNGVNDAEIRLFCVDRHDSGTNILFMDWSYRHVGFKELWTLKWHALCNTSGPWTKAGGVQPEDWPQWLRRYKDY